MKTIYFIIAIVIVLSAGCSEDFLEQPPLNNPTTGNYWNTEEEAVQAANSLYQTFMMSDAYDAGFIEFGDMMADDMVPGVLGRAFMTNIDNLNIDPTEVRITGGNDDFGFWGVWYNTIYRANWILANIEKVHRISPEIKERCINEAHFFRGVAYFNLVQYFGDVPLYTHVISPNESKNMARSSAEKVWQRVKTDLLVAAGLDENLQQEGTALPPKGKYELGRVTQGAAYGFLARYYLYHEDYEKAEIMAKKIIDLGRYDLNPDFGANWDNTMENGMESIYEIQYKSGIDASWLMKPGNSINGHTACAAFAPGGLGFNNYIAAPHFDTLFEKNSLGEEDKRRKMTIFRIGDTYPFNPEHELYLPSDKDPHGLTIAKYVLRNDIVSVQQDIHGMLDADNNIPIIRYAEILLIYAEALYQNGKTGEAFTQLNKIRERAGLDPLTGNEDFMEKLIHERRIELAFEGHRFPDLKRWGLLEEVLGPLGYRSETNGLLPIPQTEIDLNPKLTQNSGY